MKTPIFRPMSEFSPPKTGKTLVLYKPYNDGDMLYMHPLQRDANGVWCNNKGTPPLCWLDLSGCDTSRPVREIVAQAHANSDYQFADPDYFDSQFFEFNQKMQKYPIRK